MIQDVTDLEVYKVSFKLLKHLYKFITRIPISEKDTREQLKRAAKSIPANIAEGFAKKSFEKELKRFLKIAIGSSDEVLTHLRTLVITVPRLKGEAANLGQEYKTLSKRINTLHKSWRSGGNF